MMVSNYSNVELEEPKVWNCNTAPLLLHLEKEMEDEVKMVSSEQGAQVCDLAPPELREGAAQQKLLFSGA